MQVDLFYVQGFPKNRRPFVGPSTVVEDSRGICIFGNSHMGVHQDDGSLPGSSCILKMADAWDF